MLTSLQGPARGGARRSALIRAGLLILAVVASDQLAKHTLGTSVAAGSERRLLPGLKLVHVRNKGVAFGFLSGGGTVVLAFTGVALAVLVIYLLARPGRPWLWLPTGMLVGGALGNLIDRLAHGAVTDFIKLPLWPAFNLADVSITFGVLALLWVLEGPRE